MLPVTVTLSGSLLEHRLQRGRLAVVGVRPARVAVASMSPQLPRAQSWATAMRRGVGGDLQPGPLGVERADVDGDGGEAEHRHEQQREEHRGGAALAGEPAPRNGSISRCIA